MQLKQMVFLNGIQMHTILFGIMSGKVIGKEHLNGLFRLKMNLMFCSICNGVRILSVKVMTALCSLNAYLLTFILIIGALANRLLLLRTPLSSTMATCTRAASSPPTAPMCALSGRTNSGRR